MKTTLEIQEFFVEGTDQEQSHVLLHIAEPATPEEKEKGYFFVLAEINGAYAEQIVQMQNIIDEIESIYYNESDNSKNLLEKTLENINRQSHHLLGYAGSTINCIVGTFRGEALTLAYHGAPQAFLLYTKNNEIGEVNIIEGQEEDGEDQLFSALIEGTVHAGDSVYLGTPHVADYFSTDRIKKIMSSRSVRQSAAHIQKVLTDLKNEYSFGGIFFHVAVSSPASHPEKAADQESGSQESIEKLMASTRQTEDTLSPPLFGELSKKLQHEWRSRKKAHQQKKAEYVNEERPKRKVHTTIRERGRGIETNYRPAYARTDEPSFMGSLLVILGRALAVVGTGLLFTVKKLIRFIITALVALFYLATNKSNRRTAILNNWQMKIDEWKDYTTHLPLMSKILFSVTVALGLIFVGSLSYLKIKENHDVALVAYQNQVQAIIDKKDAAEARLIYGENDAAMVLLQDAQKLVDALPQNNRKQRDQKEELKGSVHELLLKFQKNTEVNPELVVDLKDHNNKAAATRMVELSDMLIAFGPVDDLLYSVNSATKNITSQKHETITGLSEASVPKEEDKIVFITRESGIAEYDQKTGALSPKTITYPTLDAKISTGFVYNRKLYLVDTAHNQIYKHSQTQTGYDKGTSWIKDSSVDVTKAISMAVDGDVFVLENTGEIVKLVGGQKQAFSIAGLDPQITAPVSIWTYNSINNLYILEPSAKRIVVIDKDGKLVGQYTSPTWKNPSAMVVDTDKKIIYILDENKIYKFGI